MDQFDPTSTAPTQDPTHPPASPAGLEITLAQQANDAIAKGADPKATTDRLGAMIRHLRANPDVAQHGVDAIANGADPGAVTGRVWQLAQQGSGNIDLRQPSDVAPVDYSAPVSRPHPTTAPASPPPPTGAGEGVVDETLDNLTLGMHHRGLGALAAIQDLATHGTSARPIDTYNASVNATKQRIAAADQQHPYLTSAANAAGLFGTLAAQGPLKVLRAVPDAIPAIADAVKPGILAGLARIGKIGVHGAVAGAAANTVANAPTTPEATASAATQGAAMGGLAGTGLATAGEVIPALSSKEQQVYDLLRQRIGNSGTTPRAIINEVAENTATSGAKPEVLGDYASEVAKLTKTAIKRPGEARAMIQQALDNRAQQTRGRMLQDLTQGGVTTATDPAAAAAPNLPSAPPEIPQRPAKPVSPAPGVRDRIATTIQDLTGAGQNDVRQAAEQAVQARANTASELFPQAHASDDVLDTPESQEMLQRPIMQKLFGRAQEAAANLGETLPTVQQRVLTPTGQRFLQESQPRDAAQLEQRLLNTPGMYTESGQRPVLNGRSMHYMDIALRQAENGFESENGISRSSAAAARQILGQLRPMRDAALPALAEAQNTYADQSGPIRAYQQGLNFLKTLTSTKAPDGAIGQGDPLALKSFRTGIDGLEQSVQNMAPEDVPRFRQAAQQALLETVRNTPADASGSTAGVLRGVLADTPLAQRAQRVLFDSPEQLAQFQAAVQQEHAGLANYRQASGAYPAQMDQHRAALQQVRQEAQLIRQSNNGNIPAQETLASRMPQGDATLRRLRMNDQVQSVNSVPATETGSTIPVLRRAFPNSPVDESRVRQLFPSQEMADRFMHALGRERHMAATNKLMGGSDTIENAAEQASITPKGIVGAIRRPMSLIGKGLDAWQDRKVTGLSKQLGPLLSANTPDALRDILLKTEAPISDASLASLVNRYAVPTGLLAGQRLRGAQ